MSLRETVTLAASGDARARQTLIEGFYPTVKRLVHAQLSRSFRHNHAWIYPLFSTGDVVHDVLVDVMRGVDAFAGDEEAEFAAYLASAVSHRLIDAVRHHQAGCRDVRRREAATVAVVPKSMPILMKGCCAAARGWRVYVVYGDSSRVIGHVGRCATCAGVPLRPSGRPRWAR